MNGLLVRKLSLDSREIAAMVGKEHKELLRDIRTYEEYLGESNLALTDFFIKNTYVSSQNKELPSYEVTKKGCEFIAHKLTGAKGAMFTATYINRFHEMEDKLQQPSFPNLNELSPQLQLLIQMELKQSQLEVAVTETRQELIDMKDMLITNDKDWRKWTNDKLKEIGAALGDYRRPRNESYLELEKRARCNLEIRLNNRIDNMKLAGSSKTAINNANYLDVIGEDTRLKEIYTSIVKEMCIKYL